MPVDLWQSATGITRNWQYLGDLQPYMLNFLENHDEQRFASDFFGMNASETFAPLYVSLLLNTAPFMVYFGEEVGERAMYEEGFSGCDGRTTIFDWWCVDSLVRLRKMIATKAYMSLDVHDIINSGLTREEAEVFCRFAQVLRFAASDEAIISGSTYDLCYCNYGSDGFDKNRHFVFLREYEDHTVLVAANFSRTDAVMQLSIPAHAFVWLGIPQTEELNPDKKLVVTVPAHSGTTITLV